MQDFDFSQGGFRDIYFFLAENNPIRETHKIYKRVPVVLTVRLPKKSNNLFSELARTICRNSSEK